MIIGIVGKANVGKSTFFKSMTLADVIIGNYPFATIKPNKGCAYVRVKSVCSEFNIQCTPRFGWCNGKNRYVAVEVMDVAGLVPGAHEGKGMGNQFLDDLRQADVLLHVVDISGTTNEKGEPCDGNYDPIKDIEFLDLELDMWYEGILKKGWDKFARQVQQEKQKISRALAAQLSGLGVKEELIEEGLKELGIGNKPQEWSTEITELARYLRKKTKPMIIIANKADMKSAEKNIQKSMEKYPERIIIPCSAESELALREAAQKDLIKYAPGDKDFEIIGELNEKQEKALKYIKENILPKLNGTGVQKAIESAVFELLESIAVFPGGVNNFKDSQGRILPDCFLLPKGSTAIDFARKIHTDLAEKFIGAMDVRTKRKVGKEHVLKHRDIMEILARN